MTSSCSLECAGLGRTPLQNLQRKSVKPEAGPLSNALCTEAGKPPACPKSNKRRRGEMRLPLGTGKRSSDEVTSESGRLGVRGQGTAQPRAAGAASVLTSIEHRLPSVPSGDSPVSPKAAREPRPCGGKARGPAGRRAPPPWLLRASREPRGATSGREPGVGFPSLRTPLLSPQPPAPPERHHLLLQLLSRPLGSVKTNARVRALLWGHLGSLRTSLLPAACDCNPEPG